MCEPQAARALADISKRSLTAQTKVAEAGAIPALVALVSGQGNAANRWSSALHKVKDLPTGTGDQPGEANGAPTPAERAEEIVANDSANDLNPIRGGTVLTRGSGTAVARAAASALIEERKRCAASALAALAENNAANQVEIAAQGGIRALVKVISSEERTAAHGDAARALYHLAVGHLENQLVRQQRFESESRPARTSGRATSSHWEMICDLTLAVCWQAVTQVGGLAPLVRMIAAEFVPPEAAISPTGSRRGASSPEPGLSAASSATEAEIETWAEWGAAAIEALARDCQENQHAIAKAGAIPPLAALLGSMRESTQASAQGALLHVAAPSAPEHIRNSVVRPLVAMLSIRDANAQLMSAETLAILASRSSAGRAAIATAGAITPFIRLLGDGRNVSTSQVFAAAGISDLARMTEHKPTIVNEGGVPALVRMLGSSNSDAKAHASSALCYLASHSTALPIIVRSGGIALLVPMLNARPDAARSAAGCLYHLAVSADNKQAIAKEGAIVPLVRLLTKTELSDAAESAAAVLASLAKEKGTSMLPRTEPAKAPRSARSSSWSSVRSTCIKAVGCQLA